MPTALDLLVEKLLVLYSSHKRDIMYYTVFRGYLSWSI